MRDTNISESCSLIWLILIWKIYNKYFDWFCILHYTKLKINKINLFPK